jgi:hypothetical protein
MPPTLFSCGWVVKNGTVCIYGASSTRASMGHEQRGSPDASSTRRRISVMRGGPAMRVIDRNQDPEAELFNETLGVPEDDRRGV